MEDNKTKDNQPQPEVDELLKNAKEHKAEFGSNQSDDINKNLGSFSTTVKQAEPSATAQIKLDVDSKVIEQAAKEKVDFEHFSKTKHEKSSKSKFGEKVSLMLRSKKGLTTTWIVELVIMTVIVVISSCMVAYLTIKLRDPYYAPILSGWSNAGKCAKVARVFFWISIFPCAIPLIYLVTAWFVGINQVASSKIFHYMFWICLIVCIVCFIVAFGVAAKPLSFINEKV